MQKSRGAGELSEMRIAESLAAQAQARLDLTLHRLRQTVVTAPFAAIVVEGDQRERYFADKYKSFPPDIERDPDRTYEYKV